MRRIILRVGLVRAREHVHGTYSALAAQRRRIPIRKRIQHQSSGSKVTALRERIIQKDAMPHEVTRMCAQRCIVHILTSPQICGDERRQPVRDVALGVGARRWLGRLSAGREARSLSDLSSQAALQVGIAQGDEASMTVRFVAAAQRSARGRYGKSCITAIMRRPQL